MCAIAPDSPDAVSVYNGRGITREDATIGAVMEAVERQTAAVCAIPGRIMTAATIEHGLDLNACGLRAEYQYVPMPFVRARDLISGGPLDVPKALVQVPWRGVAAFPLSHTNGLAAAFTWTQAVHHALLELLERHLWTITHARAHLRPKRLLREMLGEDFPFVDDPATEIAIPTGDEKVDKLCERIVRSGLRLRLVAMQHGALPVAVSAAVAEEFGPAGRCHLGAGCSWSPADAAVQAITEAMQARVADNHATRESILRFEDPAGAFANNTRRRLGLPRGRWYFDAPADGIALGELPDRSGAIDDELARMVRSIGDFAKRIAIVDLAPGERSFSVVRAIVPELETTLVDGKIGPIARAIIEDQ